MLIIQTFKFCNQNLRFSLPACCSNCEAPCCKASARSSSSESLASRSNTFSTFVRMMSTTWGNKWVQYSPHIISSWGSYLIDLGLCLLQTLLCRNLLRVAWSAHNLAIGSLAGWRSVGWWCITSCCSIRPREQKRERERRRGCTDDT